MSLKSLVAGACALLTVCASGVALADVSSWASVGAGPSFIDAEAEEDQLIQPSLELSFGFGTPPTNWLVFGGLARTYTHFGVGTDLAFALRFANKSFMTGDFGLALDLGPYQRLWGEKALGGSAALVLGGPWGFTLGVGAGKDFSGGSDQHFSCILALDFARLTVYRGTGTNWFINPFPVERPPLSAGR